jgi:hypothetical protein
MHPIAFLVHHVEVRTGLGVVVSKLVAIAAQILHADEGLLSCAVSQDVRSYRWLAGQADIAKRSLLQRFVAAIPCGRTSCCSENIHTVPGATSILYLARPSESH